MWQWQYWQSCDDLKKVGKIFVFLVKSGNGGSVGAQRVAVVGWQWYQSIRQVSAVRMVPISK
jgi:hypothetical protein